MIKHFYAIHDRIANKYTYLFESENDATATRLFMNEQSNANSLLSQSPEDFKLWRVGTFDDANGEFANEMHKVADGKPKE